MAAGIRFIAIATIVFGAVTATAQRSLPPVAAETMTFYKLPDGRVVKTAGHYYRNSDGVTCEETRLGALIIDTRNHTVTMLNSAEKKAYVFRVPGEKANGPEPTNRMAAFGKTVVEGHSVTKRRIAKPNGEKQEAWIADDVGLLVFSRSESTNVIRTTYMRNILVQEPVRSRFQVPDGYSVEASELPSVQNGLPTVPLLPVPTVPQVPNKKPGRGGGGR